ncbi:MAG: hypothetical protein C4542_07110 [Dehalococcoidia bacterium]|nr:MAG: hypothetical protein C4542_07110 [Dehalococcoidia bacterium]
MEKLDLKKGLKHLYNPSSKAPVMLDVPPMNFLAVDGKGAPDGPDAMAAMEALYPVAYTLKFTIKKGPLAIDYPVMPLEGLWWGDDMTVFSTGNKAAWKWTYMIMQPEFITADMVKKAIEEVSRKKNPPALGKMRFESFEEGTSAQIMYTGPYSAEGPTIKRLHDFIHEKGLVFDGLKQKHHEIYLFDPRRTAPEKLKTVIRQPARKP